MLTHKVKDTIIKYSMLNRGDRVLIAVSGGPDSTCLLHVLHALSSELGFTLHAAHLDHMFRGRESADEAGFVAEQAKKLGLPCTVEQLDVPAFCRERGLSAQAGAREVRYAFLSRVAAEVNANRIATGHTASDQAETVLLRLVRGAGLAGLSGIPPRRENIIRPLIKATREEILEYLQSNGIPYVSDPSNVKPVYTRNRIRLELLPVLRRFNPRIVETLAAASDLFREEDEETEKQLAAVPGIIEQKGDSVVIGREEFIALPRVYRRRLVRNALDVAGANASRLSSVRLEEAVRFMESAQTGRSLKILQGLEVARQYGSLILGPAAASKPFLRSLDVPGVTAVAELGLEVDAAVQDAGKAPSHENPDQENFFWQAMIDYDKINAEIRVRNRLPGDWFCPAGMAGKRKKLQDFFVDLKLARSERDSVPLVVAGEDIIWVAGFRLDERFLPGEDAKRILVIRIRESSK